MMNRPFDDDVLLARAKRARGLMGEHGLDALLVTGDFSAGMNYYYLSGHLPRDYQLNFSRPHAMLVPIQGEPFLYVYQVNGENAREMSCVSDVETYAPPFSGDGLAKAIAQRGLHRGRIGCELGVDQRLGMQLDEFRALEERLPEADLVDASGMLWELRMIKDEQEVEYIREADRINDEALRSGFSQLKVGSSEADVARVIGAGMIEAGAIRPPYGQILILSQAKSRALGYRARMLGPSEEFLLAPGDLLFVDSGAVVSGYWGEFNRMAVVGKPATPQRKHHDAIREIVSRSVDEALGPARSYRSIIEMMAGYYRDLGYEETQFSNYLGPPYMHLCHGIGLASSEPPFVRHDSEELLRPGMVLSCEAYLRSEEMTFGSEEDVLITENGCEVLSRRDPGLFVLEG